MTLRELAKSGLFPGDTKIYINKTEGCLSYNLEFVDRVKIDNVLSYLTEEILDKEINFIEPMINTIIIHFEVK